MIRTKDLNTDSKIFCLHSTKCKLSDSFKSLTVTTYTSKGLILRTFYQIYVSGKIKSQHITVEKALEKYNNL